MTVGWQQNGRRVASAILMAAASFNAADAQELVAEFHDIKDASFGVRVIAPPQVVREFAVCKVIWFAEKKHAAKVSLSNPSYGQPKSPGPVPIKIPDNWITLDATAYLEGGNPDGNPDVDVAERAALCRKAWDWYR